MKDSFSSYLSEKTNVDSGHFLTKTMDYPAFWKMLNFFTFLKTLFFYIKKTMFINQNKAKQSFLCSKTHGFWSKKDHFSNFIFLGNLGLENVFYDILEQNNAFLGYKHKNFKMSKNSHFSKGVNPWFWSRNRHLPNFFFKAM